jgi:hypothetical protein
VTAPLTQDAEEEQEAAIRILCLEGVTLVTLILQVSTMTA